MPIRVDAWSGDRTVRLVDTFLYDPSAPPAGTPRELAYQLIADAEVMGMGRSTRHFTNRVDLYQSELHTEVTLQIHAQMEEANRLAETTATRAMATRANVCSKRKFVGSRRAIETSSASKKSRPEPTSSSKNDAEDDKIEIELEDNAKAQSSDEEFDGVKVTAPELPSREVLARSCKHVRIRLAAYGVRVHDDFYVDPAHKDFSPLDIARRLGDDLNLPVELVQAIAVDILEQVTGRGVHDDTLMMEGGDEGHPPPDVLRDKDNVTAAWVLDQRVHITNVAHLVSHHRPIQPQVPQPSSASSGGAGT